MPQTRKKPKVLQECLNKLVPPYNDISEIRGKIIRNRPLIHSTTWMDCKGIKPNEKKPISKGYLLHDSIFIIISKKTKFYRWRTKKMVIRV